MNSPRARPVASWRSTRHLAFPLAVLAPALAGTIAFALVVALAGCRSMERPATSAATAPGAPAEVHPAALSELRPLDEAHAAEFRQAFEEAKERTRYVVALSPT